jgi:hypothetical protein
MHTQFPQLPAATDRQEPKRQTCAGKKDDMTINSSSTNYMSNASILAWMETKTDAIYGRMRDAMDVSTRRGDAEDALNTVKAQLIDLKTNGGDTAEVRQTMNEVLKDFKDVPEVTEVLQSLADKLNSLHGDHQFPEYARVAEGFVQGHLMLPAALAPSAGPVRISTEQVNDWSKAIEEKVDGMGKKDQLGMINIQEFNAQLNQAKQTASALMDSSNKSADAIISHIS